MGHATYVIEGIDAAGKATHSKRLAERVGGTVISFPYYATPVGKAILEHLKNDWTVARWVESESNYCHDPDDKRDALVFQCLQTVNRLELLPRIREALEKGPVVFDRYWASGVVYGTLDGLDRAWIERIQAPLPEPDAWVLLDIPPEEGLRRRPERRDRYERQPGLMDKVRVAYLRLFEEKRREGRNWHVVDAVGTVEEVHGRIVGKLL